MIFKENLIYNYFFIDIKVVVLFINFIIIW